MSGSSRVRGADGRGAPGTNPFALSTSLVAWLTAALLWICAIYFLVRMRGVTLERSHQAATHGQTEIS